MWISRNDWEGVLVEAAGAKAESRRYAAELHVLQETVRALTMTLSEERIRAENAIDQLLAKGGGVPVTPTRMPDPNSYPGIFDEDPDVLRELREEMNTHGVLSVLLKEGA